MDVSCGKYALTYEIKKKKKKKGKEEGTDRLISTSVDGAED